MRKKMIMVAGIVSVFVSLAVFAAPNRRFSLLMRPVCLYANGEYSPGSLVNMAGQAKVCVGDSVKGMHWDKLATTASAVTSTAPIRVSTCIQDGEHHCVGAIEYKPNGDKRVVYWRAKDDPHWDKVNATPFKKAGIVDHRKRHQD